MTGIILEGYGTMSCTLQSNSSMLDVMFLFWPLLLAKAGKWQRNFSTRLGRTTPFPNNGSSLRKLITRLEQKVNKDQTDGGKCRI
jgi:hypothetical protein